MARRLPPAQALHAFEAAARHMSFTEAARELGVTQAAISQRIRLLEHRLGQPLFLRHPRGLELTDAGRALVPAVHDAFERLTSGIAEVFGAPADAPLTVRMTPGFAAHWLAPRLPILSQAVALLPHLGLPIDQAGKVRAHLAAAAGRQPLRWQVASGA